MMYTTVTGAERVFFRQLPFQIVLHLFIASAYVIYVAAICIPQTLGFCLVILVQYFCT